MDEYDERRERNRQAQARYKKAHAEILSTARRVGQILMRQTWYARDATELAAAIRGLIGRECCRDLARALFKEAKAKGGRR
jgi:hypothetical protein